MAFFDEVETTVANTRFIKAVEGGPVTLDYEPIDALSELKTQLLGEYNDLSVLLKPKTFCNYLFFKYLRLQGHSHLVDFVHELESKFRPASSNAQVELAQTLVDKYFTASSSSQPAPADDANAPLVANNNNSSNNNNSNNNDNDNDKTSVSMESLVRSNKVAPSVVELPSFLQKHKPGVIDTVKQVVASKDEGKVGGVFDEAEEAIVTFWRGGGVLEGFKTHELFDECVQLTKYKDRPISLADFQIFRSLGRGAFGLVSVAQKNDTKAIYAIKQMDKKQVKHNDSEKMCIMEHNVLAMMKQPFVLNLSYSFHDDSSLYLVFEMCTGGDLRYHLRGGDMGKPTNFSTERTVFYAAEVLLGLEHMHSFNIVYRDLKPNNILLTKEGHAKITDLGLTIQIKEGKSCRHLAGTAGYWAPEIVQKTGTYFMSDFWSLGVLIYEMITGKPPKSKAKKGTKEWSPFGHERENETLAKSEEGVLVLDIDYNHADLQKCPDAIDLLKKLFESDPMKRLGANGHQEIKAHPFFAAIDWAKLQRMEVDPPYQPEADRVHADSIAEVGSFNTTKYKNIKLSDDDRRIYDVWNFRNEEVVQKELAEALDRRDNYTEDTEKTKSESGICCVIL